MKALQSAAKCLSTDTDAPSVRMGDNKQRVSSAAQTTNGIPGVMSGLCGSDADSLRAAIDGAVYQLLKAMDKYSTSFQNKNKKVSEYAMEPYRRYTDILQNGEHLGEQLIKRKSLFSTLL